MLSDSETRDICINVANQYFDLDIVADKTRRKTTTKARYVLCALVFQNTDYSSPEISEFLDVDHTTVLRSLRHVDRKLLRECQKLVDQDKRLMGKDDPTVFPAACRSALNYSHIGGDWEVAAKKYWQSGGRRKDIGQRFSKSDQIIIKLIKQWRDECAE